MNPHRKQASFSVIIMAAGQGSRMGSNLPKTLHPVAGRPLLSRILDSLFLAGIHDIRLVVSPESESIVKKLTSDLNVTIFTQSNPQGTAHAVEVSKIESLNENVIILNGDHPLIEAEDILNFIGEFQDKKSYFSVVTTILNHPKHYGRIIRSQNRFKCIVEARDASQEVLKIKEINTGIFLLKSQVLQKNLPLIKESRRGERFITDLIDICSSQFEVHTIKGEKRVAFGVNTQRELSQATSFVFRKKAFELMEQGVVIIDPLNTYIEDSVKIKPATVIYPGCYIQGKTEIDSFCSIEPHCVLSSAKLQRGVIVRPCVSLEKEEIPEFTLVTESTKVKSKLQPVEKNQES